MKKALLVGINAYGHGSDLSGCVNDSLDFGAEFKRRGFETNTLLDKQATRANIIERLKAMIAEAKSGDSLIFQYSGHGSYVPDESADEADGLDECICPVDLWSAGQLTDDDLRTIYANRPLGIKMLIISDSCHSGTVTRFAPILTPPTTQAAHSPQRKVRFLPPETFLSEKQMAKLRGVSFRRSLPAGRHAGLLMSGCADPEYSFDSWFNGRPNGSFTYVALDTLKKLPANASYQRWFNEIRKVLPSSQYPQTPALYGSSTMKRWKVLS